MTIASKSVEENVTIGFHKMAAYALPAIGFGYLLFFGQFCFLKFGADVLLLPSVLVGGLIYGRFKLFAKNGNSNGHYVGWSDDTGRWICYQ